MTVVHIVIHEVPIYRAAILLDGIQIKLRVVVCKDVVENPVVGHGMSAPRVVQP